MNGPFATPPPPPFYPKSAASYGEPFSQGTPPGSVDAAQASKAFSSATLNTMADSLGIAESLGSLTISNPDGTNVYPNVDKVI